mgnify:CR=1 FL=1
MSKVNNYDVKSLLEWQRVDLDGPFLHYARNRYAGFTLEICDAPSQVQTAIDPQNTAAVLPAGIPLRPGQTLACGIAGNYPKSLFVRLAPEHFGLVSGITYPSFWANVPRGALLNEQYAKVASGQASTYAAMHRGLAQSGALQTFVTLVSGDYRVGADGEEQQSVVMPANLLVEAPFGLALNTLTWNGTHWGVAGQTQLCIVHPAALMGTAIATAFRRARLCVQFKYTGTTSINLAQQGPLALDVYRRNLPAVGLMQLQRIPMGSVINGTTGYLMLDAGPLEDLLNQETNTILAGGLAFANWFGFSAAPATRQYQIQAFWVLDQGEPCADIDCVAFSSQVLATNVTAGNGFAVWAPGSAQGVFQLDSLTDAIAATASLSQLRGAGGGSVIFDQVTAYVDESTPATLQATGVAPVSAGATYVSARQKSVTPCGWLIAANAGSWSNARPAVYMRRGNNR